MANEKKKKSTLRAQRRNKPSFSEEGMGEISTARQGGAGWGDISDGRKLSAQAHRKERPQHVTPNNMLSC